MVEQNTEGYENRNSGNAPSINRTDINRIEIMGNVGRDPELKTQGTRVVAIFSVATSKTITLKDGTIKTNTEWHRVHVYGEARANAMISMVKKGAKVFVQGEMRSSALPNPDQTNNSNVNNNANNQQRYYSFIEASMVSLPVLPNYKDSANNSPNKHAVDNMTKYIDMDDFPL